jgi:hypothetical protein
MLRCYVSQTLQRVRTNNACFIVRDHAGQALAYVYFEDRTDRRITVEATSDE